MISSLEKLKFELFTKRLSSLKQETSLALFHLTKCKAAFETALKVTPSLSAISLKEQIGYLHFFNRAPSNVFWLLSCT